MSKMQINSGIYFDFLNPTADMIKLEDITCCLSKESRFSGNLDKEWTVLQHVLLVYHLVRIYGGTTKEQFTALHHDDPEAYFKDLSTPLKELCNDYKRLYNLTAKVVENMYDIRIIHLPYLVKEMDRNAMLIEDVLFSNTKSDWHEFNKEKFEEEDEKLEHQIIQVIDILINATKGKQINMYMMIHKHLKYKLDNQLDK